MPFGEAECFFGEEPRFGVVFKLGDASFDFGDGPLLPTDALLDEEIEREHVEIGELHGKSAERGLSVALDDQACDPTGQLLLIGDDMGERRGGALFALFHPRRRAGQVGWQRMVLQREQPVQDFDVARISHASWYVFPYDRIDLAAAWVHSKSRVLKMPSTTTGTVRANRYNPANESIEKFTGSRCSGSGSSVMTLITRR